MCWKRSPQDTIQAGVPGVAATTPTIADRVTMACVTANSRSDTRRRVQDRGSSTANTLSGAREGEDPKGSTPNNPASGYPYAYGPRDILVIGVPASACWHWRSRISPISLFWCGRFNLGVANRKPPKFECYPSFIGFWRCPLAIQQGAVTRAHGDNRPKKVNACEGTGKTLDTRRKRVERRCNIEKCM